MAWVLLFGYNLYGVPPFHLRFPIKMVGVSLLVNVENPSFIQQLVKGGARALFTGPLAFAPEVLIAATPVKIADTVVDPHCLAAAKADDDFDEEPPEVKDYPSPEVAADNVITAADDELKETQQMAERTRSTGTGATASAPTAHAAPKTQPQIQPKKEEKTKKGLFSMFRMKQKN